MIRTLVLLVPAVYLFVQLKFRTFCEKFMDYIGKCMLQSRKEIKSKTKRKRSALVGYMASGVDTPEL